MWKVYTDGASRNNPGHASAGWVVYNLQGEEHSAGKKYLGEKTNNQAEYLALIAGIKEVLPLNAEFCIYMDSELIVKQMKGEYKIKNKELLPLWQEAQDLLLFKNWNIVYIPREHNKRADALANEALDTALNTRF
jgi:ribonuclease HI